jgi:protein-S-isoprenylcysteine O-methyltransferase Ste14
MENLLKPLVSFVVKNPYNGSLFVAIFFVILAISFVLRTRKEEAIMIKLFGEKYTDYMKRTKRLIPLIY